MNLDEQLTELLATLGVELEERGAEREMQAGEAQRDAGCNAAPETGAARPPRAFERSRERDSDKGVSGVEEIDAEAQHEPEFSLFQTSREHYGVFYRLDLIQCVPQLRIFTPEELGAIKMRCYLVRPSLGTPVREWFLTTRLHDGSPLFEEARETTEQHLLFAAGETLKRLFWGGDTEAMRFSNEIEVQRLV